MSTPLLDAAQSRLAAMRLQRHLIEVPVIGDIVAQASGRGVCALHVAHALRRDPMAPVRLTINSHGGLVSESVAIHDELKGHKGVVVADVIGACDSGATLVLAAAEARAAPLSTRMILHPPAVDRIEGDGWTADRLRALADRLDQHADRLVSIYAAASDAPPWWWGMRMNAGRPIGAHDLASAGLLTHVDGRPWTLRPWRDADACTRRAAA